MQIPHINPYGRAIKKYLYEMLKDDYTEQLDETADRIAHTLVTKRDAENVIQLLSKLYGAGYKKALDSAKETLEKHGYNLKIVPPKEFN